MAILQNKTNLKAGDAVTAELINDVVETAIEANKTAVAVSNQAESGDFNGTDGKCPLEFSFDGTTLIITEK